MSDQEERTSGVVIEVTSRARGEPTAKIRTWLLCWRPGLSQLLNKEAPFGLRLAA